MPVVSDRREATWGGCVRTDGTLCASLDETAVLIRLKGTHKSTEGADDHHNRTAGDPDGTLHHRTVDDSSRRRGANGVLLLWPPTTPGALRVHRYTGRAWGGHSTGIGDGRGTGNFGRGGKGGRGGPSGAASHSRFTRPLHTASSHAASHEETVCEETVSSTRPAHFTQPLHGLFGLVVDPFGRAAFEACLATRTPSYDRGDDARSDDARSDDALAFSSWAPAASEAVTHGDGLAMFRQGPHPLMTSDDLPH